MNIAINIAVLRLTSFKGGVTVVNTSNYVKLGGVKSTTFLYLINSINTAIEIDSVTCKSL